MVSPKPKTQESDLSERMLEMILDELRSLKEGLAVLDRRVTEHMVSEETERKQLTHQLETLVRDVESEAAIRGNLIKTVSKLDTVIEHGFPKLHTGDTDIYGHRTDHESLRESSTEKKKIFFTLKEDFTKILVLFLIIYVASHLNEILKYAELLK